MPSSTSPNLLSSPTSSTTSSFDIVSSLSRSSTMSSHSRRSSIDQSDDEIVWTVSDDSLTFSDLSIESSVFPPSGDDFVVLRRPRSPTSRTGFSTPSTIDCSRTSSSIADVTSSLAAIALNQVSSGSICRDNVAAGPSSNDGATEKIECSRRSQPVKRPRRRKQSASTRAIHSRHLPASSPHSEQSSSDASSTKAPSSPVVALPAKAAKPKIGKGKRKASARTGLGSRPIVDDISEIVDDKEDELVMSSMYEEAVKYITSFLSNPSGNDRVCRLTFLQSLIIELGISSSSLPHSLKSAKAILKSRAFLNIREYLAVRGQGHAAVQRIMHPSKNALIKDIRAKRNPVPLEWVKENGLQVLLVSRYH